MRSFGHHSFDARDNALRQRAAAANQRRRRVDQMPFDLGGGCLVFRSVEWRLAGQKVIERASQTVDVGANVNLVSVTRLLGCQKVERSQHLAGRRNGRPIRDQPRDPKIDQLGHPVAVDEQVGRLDVAMHQPVFVGVLQPESCLNHHLASIGG